MRIIKMKPENKEIKTNLSAMGGNERILCVDDEKEIVRVEQQILERLGYLVTSKSSGVEALAAFQIAPDNYDLVITDMSMPDITGIKLAEQLVKIRKDIPIILCTGFSERLNGEKAKLIGIRAFLMKPVKMSDLAETIRKVLDTIPQDNIMESKMNCST